MVLQILFASCLAAGGEQRLPGLTEGIVRQRVAMPEVALEPRGGVFPLVKAEQFNVSMGPTYAFAAPGLEARLSVGILGRTLTLVCDGELGHAVPQTMSAAAKIVYWSFYSHPWIQSEYSYARMRAGLELRLHRRLTLFAVVEGARLWAHERSLPSALVAAGDNHFMEHAALRGVSSTRIGLSLAL
jgi:hypothetical protein